jgi:hypothetical protein
MDRAFARLCRSTKIFDGVEMDNLTKRDTPDRSKINMSESWEVKYWTRELGISRAELQKIVDKVGNSAATVRKEIANR